MTQNPQALARDRALAAPSPTYLLDLVQDKLAAAEELFRLRLGSDVPFIQNAGEYIFRGGGKRVRPALLLLSSRLLGHDGDEEVTYAAVVELIHTATLIHDDIIDHAALRRGQATPNDRWGNSLTVLLGDWIYTTAMQMALEHDNVAALKALVAATLRMTEGELMAQQRLSCLDLSVDEYFEITERKTARLFAAAAALPSLIQPAQPAAGQALGNYGRALGICYQLVDDLLDFTADERELGKPALSDLKEGKLTLPLLLALPRTSEGRREAVRRVLEDGSFERTAAEEILETVRQEGTIEEVRLLAERYALEAQEQLASLPACDARDALELAPDFVLYRRA